MEMKLFSDHIDELEKMREKKIAELTPIVTRKQELMETSFTYSSLREIERQQEDLVTTIHEIDENLAFYNWATNKGKELMEDEY